MELTGPFGAVLRSAHNKENTSDARAEHPYHDLAVREHGLRAVAAERDTVAVQDNGAHMMIVS